MAKGHWLHTDEYYDKFLRGMNLDRHTRHRRKYKLDAIEAYGGRCACCGEERWEFLALDHIDGGGNKKRKSGQPQGEVLYRMLARQGHPIGEFRVLCHNCNQALGNFGYCPHNP